MNTELNLMDSNLQELKTSEQLEINGGSGASYGIGWLVGAALAMPLILLAAGTLAITASMQQYPSGGELA